MIAKYETFQMGVFFASIRKQPLWEMKKIVILKSVRRALGGVE